MTVLFDNQKKWILKGLGWFLTALVVLLTIYLDVYLKERISPTILILQLIFTSVSVYQGIHHMTKHEKAYVRAGEKYLSIYRSSWTPREKISYDRIEDFYEVSTLLVLQLKNGKETQFDLELFSNSDVERIKRLIDRKI